MLWPRELAPTHSQTGIPVLGNLVTDTERMWVLTSPTSSKASDLEQNSSWAISAISVSVIS